MTTKSPYTALTIVFLLLISSAKLTASQAQLDRSNDVYNYGKLSPAIAVTIVILIAAIFFMGFFSIYFRHYSNLPDTGVSPPVGIRSRVIISPMAARGLDSSIIEAFPSFVYSEVKTQKLGKGELECAICLNEFENDETLRLIPKCDHVFHPHCISAWLEGHVTCPVCRANLAEQVTDGKTVEPEIELDQVLVYPEPVINVPEHEQSVTVDLKRVKFSRSHTTGHSVIQPGECTDRFTLRLPEDVRKRMMANWKLNRSNSLLVLSNSRRGNSKPIDRSRDRSDRWLFSKTPSFMWRSKEDGSIRLGAVSSVRTNTVPTDRWAILRNASFLWRSEGSSVKSVRTSGSSSGSVRLPV
ncbi:unnamed protein product [Cochlearia groenlandica]